MSGLKLDKRLQDTLSGFARSLQKVYNENLVSVILYGSAASGEFVNRRSNLNLLVVLKNSDLGNLEKVSELINGRRFRLIQPLFLTEDYIKDSLDIFPIEFLDMKESYNVLLGNDILKDLSIDTKNLRFQCEQELRSRLITLRQLYLRNSKNNAALSLSLFKYLTSIIHILRNVLRIIGKQSCYLKQDVLKDIAAEFQIDRDTWHRILSAKNKQIRLDAREIKPLFITFVSDLEKIVNLVDRL